MAYLIGVDDLRNLIIGVGAVDCTIGSTTFKGKVRDPDDALFQSDPELFANAKTVLAVTADLPTIASSAAITVDGVAMKIHAVHSLYEGSMTRLVVKLA